MRYIAIVVLPIVLAGCTAAWNADYSTVKRPDPVGRSYEVEMPQREQPSLDPTRKVTDADCTQPVDPGGTLRCR